MILFTEVSLSEIFLESVQETLILFSFLTGLADMRSFFQRQTVTFVTCNKP